MPGSPHETPSQGGDLTVPLEQKGNQAGLRSRWARLLPRVPALLPPSTPASEGEPRAPPGTPSWQEWDGTAAGCRQNPLQFLYEASHLLQECSC